MPMLHGLNGENTTLCHLASKAQDVIQGFVVRPILSLGIHVTPNTYIGPQNL